MSTAFLLDHSMKAEVELENWLQSPTSTTKSGTNHTFDKRVFKIRISKKEKQMAKEAKRRNEKAV